MSLIPVAIRKRIIELYDSGHKTQYIAQAVGRCKSAVRRVRQHYRERNTLEPRTHLRGRRSGFDDKARQKLAELVNARPDATLAELALEMNISDSTVDRWLTMLRLSLKKNGTGRRAGPGRCETTAR